MPQLWVVLPYVIKSLQTISPDPALLEDQITPWMGPLAPWMRHFSIDDEERARRWFLACLIFSLLLHVALLMIPISQKIKMGQPSSGPLPQSPLSVRLTRPAPSEATNAEVKPTPKPPQHQPTVIAKRRTNTASRPAFTVPPPSELPKEQVQSTSNPDQPTDMSSYVEANRERRRLEEEQAAMENASAAAASNGPSRDEIIAANINRNRRMSKSDGTGGVFQITRIGVREGEFRFNGWHPGADNWHESYTVDSVNMGLGGNVRLAIATKVIEVIRKYKTGDFEFESRRLGHPVRMSARPEDNEVLVAFLMKELFDEDAQIKNR